MKKTALVAAAASVSMLALCFHLAAASDVAGLYASRCGSCHGAKGEGAASPAIPPVKGTTLTAEELVVYIMKGDAAKQVHATPIVNLTGDEAVEIAKYVTNLR